MVKRDKLAIINLISYGDLMCHYHKQYCIAYLRVAKRVDFKSFHYKKKKM